MTSHPNYRRLAPPADKAPTEYSYVERRAELYDAIEEAGHYRNLERTRRDLGERYGVTHKTIQNDIAAINEWKAAHLGDHAEAELETLKTAAIQSLLDDGEVADAYYLMKAHFAELRDAGYKPNAPTEIGLNVDPGEAYIAALQAAHGTGDE